MATATKQHKAKRVRLSEDIVRGAKPTVDRDKGIIAGVKVLGLVSANGRRYLPEAIAAAVSLYEGLSVRLNHPKKPTDSRDANDVFGVLQNVTQGQDGCLYADLHYMKSHPFAERLCEAAERFPSLIGLSHNADGEGENRGGQFVITKITEVRSVDIVADPATTGGLFEERRPMKLKTFFESINGLDDAKKAGVLKLFEMGMMDDDLEAPADVAPAEAPPESADDALWSGFKAAIVAVIDDADMGAGDKHKKIGELLKAHEKLVGGGEAPEEPVEEEEEKDAKDKSDKKDEDKEKMKEELRHLKARENARELCEAANVKPSKTLLKALCALESDTDRKALIEESKGGSKLQTPTNNKARTSPPNAGKNGQGAAKPADDYAQFMESVKK